MTFHLLKCSSQKWSRKWSSDPLHQGFSARWNAQALLCDAFGDYVPWRRMETKTGRVLQMVSFVRSFVERCCLNWPELLHSIYIFYTAYHNIFKQMHRIGQQGAWEDDWKMSCLSPKLLFTATSDSAIVGKGYHLFGLLYPIGSMEKWYICLHEWLIFMVNLGKYAIFIIFLVGGFKHFLFSSHCGEDEPNLTHIFQMGWNHQPVLFIILYMHHSQTYMRQCLCITSGWNGVLLFQFGILFVPRFGSRPGKLWGSLPPISVELLTKEVPANWVWCHVHTVYMDRVWS